MQTVEAKIKYNQQSKIEKLWQRGWQKCGGGRQQTTATQRQQRSSGNSDGKGDGCGCSGYGGGQGNGRRQWLK
jgi:hypothetical protein